MAKDRGPAPGARIVSVPRMLAVPEEPAPGKRKLQSFLRAVRSRLGGPVPVLLFVAGLLLGWLVIGWLVWPTVWTNTSPWDMSTAYQKRYVWLVAAQYGRAHDVTQTQQDMAGWKESSLKTLLATMEKEAPNAEAKQELAALQQVLALPASAAPKPRKPIKLDPILLSAGVALLLQIGAIGVAVVPRLVHKVRAARQARVEAQAVFANTFAVGAQELEPWMAAFKGVSEDEAAAAAMEAAEAEARLAQGGAAPGEPGAPGSAPGAEKGGLAAKLAAAKAAEGKDGEAQKEGSNGAAAKGDGKSADGKGGDAKSADGKSEDGKKDGEKDEKGKLKTTKVKLSGENQPSDAIKVLEKTNAAKEDEKAQADEEVSISDLFETLEAVSPQREALNRLVERVEIKDLMPLADKVLDDLRAYVEQKFREAA